METICSMKSSSCLEIESVTATIVDVPTRRPLQMAFTAVTQQSYVIVEVRAGGWSGFGEASSIGGPTWGPDCAESVKAVIDAYFAPVLLRTDAANLTVARHTLQRAAIGHMAAKSALETALCDLKARSLGVSVGELLGGACRHSIPVAWTLASGVAEEDIRAAREQLAARRHKLFKVKIGAGLPRDDVRRVAAIKQGLGDEASIRVDLNQAWDEATARRWLPELSAVGVDLVEQPIARQNIEGLRRLRAAGTVALMADESVNSLDSILSLTARSCVDVLSLKVVNLGGAAETLKAAAIAEAGGLAVYGGTMLDSAIGTSFALQVFSTLQALPFGCELIGPEILADALGDRQLEIRDFEIHVPPGPGCGVAPVPEKLERYRRR